MIRWFQKVKKEGLSLRLTFILMLIVSLGVTAVLLFTTYRTLLSYHSLSAATDTYIELQEAAASLLDASDYLTQEARCYVVLGDRRHLENYFEEAEVTRRREQAIAVMEEHLPNSSALFSLKTAMDKSVALMTREYYAMMLVLSAEGDEDIPEAMRDVKLSEKDTTLTPEAKKQFAQTIMHNDDYYLQKYRIRTNLENCLKELKANTHGTQNEMGNLVSKYLVRMVALIILQSVNLILLLLLTTRLGINPLLRAVEHIKKDQRLPVIGAHEFRYLAGTYNKMYSAYKKSIDNLSFKASHDELTQVYNRAGYDLIKFSIDPASTALLLVDADKFKQINDQNGHEIGDKILKKIADTLKRHFRPEDYIFRIGGDEFVVFMVHTNERTKYLIEQKVAQINEVLADTDDGLPPVSVSVGVSLGTPGSDPQEMFREADKALYQVKDRGRKGCCIYNYSPGVAASKAKTG